MKAARIHDIDRCLQKVSKVFQQSAQIEDVSPRVEVDQKVNITAGASFLARDRAENPNVARTVPPRQFEDGGTLFGLEHFESHVNLNPLCLRMGICRQSDKITVAMIPQRW